MNIFIIGSAITLFAILCGIAFLVLMAAVSRNTDEDPVATPESIEEWNTLVANSDRGLLR